MARRRKPKLPPIELLAAQYQERHARARPVRIDAAGYAIEADPPSLERAAEMALLSLTNVYAEYGYRGKKDSND